ncbi:MAG: Sec-independent protein translocase subunit TatA/TatB [Leptospira bouyouniensis]|uniref:Sec-independent protein translocase protein TatA n=1 Tax=Leptospira bouyouniensis TaxID=2484911 RepID=A0A7I0HN17_9LEPT|nr:twin-arginine translocase TatA/TatE family subunit [Leptospira bouyouniensis]TGK46880.1 twin-arginine translocase TatA/TatE family subunit [Leptospira bouyouniensis]TGL03052.1 twin-arginine translocase TatA/TatE family subunit [Leptospira bouyouniensis]TGM79983.1 twin-arginine translocase TatA/TatE family subunit [Leptospira bouyouniensis]
MPSNPFSFQAPIAFFNLGPWEIALIVFLALLFFGGKRLPSLAKDLGSGIKEFRKSLTGQDEEPAQTSFPVEEPKQSAQSNSKSTKKKKA